MQQQRLHKDTVPRNLGLARHERLVFFPLLQIGSIPAEERARIKDIIDAGSTDRSAISTDMFDGLQKIVFNEMFYNTFQRFVETPAYTAMREDMKNAYNKVTTFQVRLCAVYVGLESRCERRGEAMDPVAWIAPLKGSLP